MLRSSASRLFYSKVHNLFAFAGRLMFILNDYGRRQ